MTYPIWAFLLLFGAMIVGLFLGLPVAFVLGGVATIAILIIWGFDGTYVLANAAYSTFSTDTYLAIAMFLLMGNVLQKSGIADDLYEMLFKWMGGLKGGLAMGTVIICAIFGAMCGGRVSAPQGRRACSGTMASSSRAAEMVAKSGHVIERPARRHRKCPDACKRPSSERPYAVPRSSSALE